MSTASCLLCFAASQYLLSRSRANPYRSAYAPLPSRGRAAWRGSRSRASPWRSVCEPLHGRPSAASVEAGMVGAEDAEPVETAGDGGGDDALLEAVDAHETVDEVVAAHDDEVKYLLQ